MRPAASVTMTPSAIAARMFSDSPCSSLATSASAPPRQPEAGDLRHTPRRGPAPGPSPDRAGRLAASPWRFGSVHETPAAGLQAGSVGSHGTIARLPGKRARTKGTVGPSCGDLGPESGGLVDSCEAAPQAAGWAGEQDDAIAASDATALSGLRRMHGPGGPDAAEGGVRRGCRPLRGMAVLQSASRTRQARGAGVALVHPLVHR